MRTRNPPGGGGKGSRSTRYAGPLVLLLVLVLLVSGCVGKRAADDAGEAPVVSEPSLRVAVSFDLSESGRVGTEVRFVNLDSGSSVRNVSGSLTYIEGGERLQNRSFSIGEIPPNSTATLSEIFTGENSGERELELYMNSSVGSLTRRFQVGR